MSSGKQQTTVIGITGLTCRLSPSTAPCSEVIPIPHAQIWKKNSLCRWAQCSQIRRCILVDSQRLPIGPSVAAIDIFPLKIAMSDLDTAAVKALTINADANALSKRVRPVSVGHQRTRNCAANRRLQRIAQIAR